MPEARAYLGDGRLELDNNICERSIRPVAPGRKNCLFLGSVGGGEAAAIAYALIETAKMNNVDPEAWLTWVLERVADHGLTPSTNLCRGTGSPKTSKTRPDRTDTFRLDAAAVQTVPGQRGLAAAACAGLQPGHVPALHRTIRSDGRLVVDQPPAQADQDWRSRRAVTPAPSRSSWPRWRSPAP